MKINLISQEEFETLKSIFESNPSLTLQNTGYEVIDERKLSDDDKAKRSIVTDILRKSVYGFSEFSNFKTNNKNNEIVIRLQYNYGWDGGLHFIGVGYIKLKELLNGFE